MSNKIITIMENKNKDFAGQSIVALGMIVLMVLGTASVLYWVGIDWAVRIILIVTVIAGWLFGAGFRSKK